ncbi:MAG: SH3 domain-containing protein [Bacteroidota bacterium]
MKAKQMLSILTLLTICLFTNAQQKLHCSRENCEFESGEVTYLFGNQVQLREGPTTTSKVLKTLAIGTQLVILEKHENSWRYKGVDSNFYKVGYKGIEGYVLGGLMAIERKIINEVTHLFGHAKTGNEDYLLIRSLKEDGSFTEKATRLEATQFYLLYLGTMGVPDLQGILLVDYVSEGCGSEGGGIYLFQQDEQLHQVARLSQVSDAGAYYFWEEFVFPDDDHGAAGKILFKKEKGEYMDKESNWTRITKETRELTWANGSLFPDNTAKQRL